MRRSISMLVAVCVALWPLGGGVRLAGGEPPKPLNEALAIVVNVNNPVENMPSAALHGIFLGIRSHWADGKRITLVMHDPGRPERVTLLRDVCGLSEQQFKMHFIHGLYTGEILSTPKILSSPSGVRKFIFNVPGAIGYLRLSDVDATVKVIRVDNLLPSDRNYRLHVVESEQEKP